MMRASGAGGSNRAASYACIVALPNIHHEIARIFRVRQLRRTNSGTRAYRPGVRRVFDAQMNASSLGQRKLFKRAECALAEDGFDVAEHEAIITGTRYCYIGAVIRPSPQYPGAYRPSRYES
jgi:hypothetical protein